MENKDKTSFLLFALETIGRFSLVAKVSPRYSLCTTRSLDSNTNYVRFKKSPHNFNCSSNRATSIKAKQFNSQITKPETRNIYIEHPKETKPHSRNSITSNTSEKGATHSMSNKPRMTRVGAASMVQNTYGAELVLIFEKKLALTWFLADNLKKLVGIRCWDSMLGFEVATCRSVMFHKEVGHNDTILHQKSQIFRKLG